VSSLVIVMFWSKSNWIIMLIIFGNYLGSNFRDESLNIEFLLLYNSSKCLNCNIVFSIHTNKHTFQVGFHLAVIQMT